MNFLTGASACARKAIYEFLILEGFSEGNYDERIKLLKNKYGNADEELFDVLGSIKDMTSNKVHEQSWDKWDSNILKMIIEALKAVLYDIHVVPAMRKERISKVKQLEGEIKVSKNNQTSKSSDQ